MEKKNYGKSVKTRLLNLMNETGYKYMYLFLPVVQQIYQPFMPSGFSTAWHKSNDGNTFHLTNKY